MIGILYDYILHPIRGTRFVFSRILSPHFDMLFPSIIQHLLLYLAGDIETAIFYLFVDVAVPIVANYPISYIKHFKDPAIPLSYSSMQLNLSLYCLCLSVSCKKQLRNIRAQLRSPHAVLRLRRGYNIQITVSVKK